MRRILTVALCLTLMPIVACGQDLQGRWKATTPDLPSYAGTAWIDAEGRVLSGDDFGPDWRGFIVHADNINSEFALTNGRVVERVFCIAQAADLLHCHHHRYNGVVSGLAIWTRIGDSPRNIMLMPPK